MNVLSFNNGNNMFIHRIAFPIPDNMIQEAGTHRMLPKNFAQNVDTPYYDASVRIDFDNNASAASIWDGLMEKPGPLDEIAETIADILSIDYTSHINIFCAKPDILIVWFKQLMQFTKVILDEDAEDDEWDEDGAVGEREIIEKNVYRFMAFCDAGYASGFILFNNNDADEVEDEANVTSFLSHIRPEALIDVESVNISFSGNKNSTDFLNKYIKKTIWLASIISHS